MSVLHVFLFGNVRILCNSGAANVKLTRNSQALLAYLLLQRYRTHPRETLAGLFWADHSEERARSCLSTALWRLRCVLEHEGIVWADLMISSASEIGINPECHFWLDTQVFEERVIQVLTQPEQIATEDTAQELKHALHLYRGDLLEGFYDDWVLRERERLRNLYLSSLSYLMRYYHRQHIYEQSLIHAHQILQLDPLREEVQREVMLLYTESGQPSLALRQYQTFCKILETELAILPISETQALYRQIVLANGSQQSPASFITEPTGLHRALKQLQQARQNFDEAQRMLQQAIELVDQLTNIHFSGIWDLKDSDP